MYLTLLIIGMVASAIATYYAYGDDMQYFIKAIRRHFQIGTRVRSLLGRHPDWRPTSSSSMRRWHNGRWETRPMEKSEYFETHWGS